MAFILDPLEPDYCALQSPAAPLARVTCSDHYLVDNGGAFLSIRESPSDSDSKFYLVGDLSEKREQLIESLYDGARALSKTETLILVTTLFVIFALLFACLFASPESREAIGLLVGAMAILFGVAIYRLTAHPRRMLKKFKRLFKRHQNDLIPYPANTALEALGPEHRVGVFYSPAHVDLKDCLLSEQSRDETVALLKTLTGEDLNANHLHLISEALRNLCELERFEKIRKLEAEQAEKEMEARMRAEVDAEVAKRQKQIQQQRQETLTRDLELLLNETIARRSLQGDYPSTDFR